MTCSNGTILRDTGHLCGEFTGPDEFPHKGQWRGALMFSLICAWINVWVNNREAGDLRRHRGHYDVNVMLNIVSPHRQIGVVQFPSKHQTLHYWHFVMGTRWIPLTKGQWCGKHFHVMNSSCRNTEGQGYGKGMLKESDTEHTDIYLPWEIHSQLHNIHIKLSQLVDHAPPIHCHEQRIFMYRLDLCENRSDSFSVKHLPKIPTQRNVPRFNIR